mgnify:FL=1
MVVGKKRRGATDEPEQPRAWSIEEVVNSRGKRIVALFIATLEGVNADEAKALLTALVQRGNALGMPDSKGLGGGLFELRGGEVRIFYTFRPGQRIILLDTMLKKRTDIPKRFVERLRKLVKRIA